MLLHSSTVIGGMGSYADFGKLFSTALDCLFDAYYSVDSVERYKPFEDIYLYVAAQEHLDVKDIAMVATLQERLL